MLEKLFHLQASGTDVKREIVAGCTTFMTLSYIIFVQPAILAAAGMDANAVMVATCISSAVATVLMAFLANYPIALAPAMGHNFYFAFTVCLTLGVSWQHALGAVFIAGALFFLLASVGLRETVMTVLPNSLKNAIPVGIGLLIALVGLEWAGIVVAHPATYVTLGKLKSAPALLSLFGVGVIAALFALKVRGAILIGILASTVVGLAVGMVKFQGVVAPPPSISATFLKLQIPNIFADTKLITVILVFMFLDLFDTVGTLIGVSQQAGLMVDGKLPKARQALLSDAIATCVGALLGTSTVTSYIESASGISAGGRTGLANIVTAALMLLALFFNPLIKMVGAGYPIGDNTFLYPIVAPALIIVGSLMLKNVIHIDWDDATESIPAFLTLLMMPLTFSITEGIAFGFISYALLKLVSGRGKQVHWLISLFAVLFVVRYIWLVG
ncbi:NCS2 family permease [Candidatus Poribacteria bacterium]|nr:NCS2 family permease [Candidatus Poribacteria bacterium]